MTLTAIEGFDPRNVSPSRLNTYVSCGVAFHMRYVQGLPAERSGSAALFGSVIHKALEVWGLDRTRDLTQLIRDAWITETTWDEKPTSVTEFIKAYQPISIECIRAEHDARLAFEKRTGKPSKAPRMSGEFKKSAAYKKLNALLGKWHDRLNDESPWRFSEFDPLPTLYDESLVLSKRYAHHWGHLPNVVHTEFKVEELWRGFTINGYIDTIEPLIDRSSGELIGVGVNDYKTYRKPPPEMKDWRQVTMYDAAVRSLVARGALVLPWDLDKVPLYIGIDYVRGAGLWFDADGKDISRRYWRAEEADYERLERELNAYFQGVTHGVFLPAEKGRNPDFCDYGEACCLRSCAAAGGSARPVEVNL